VTCSAACVPIVATAFVDHPRVVVTSCCRLCSGSSTVTWNCSAVVVVYQLVPVQLPFRMALVPRPMPSHDAVASTSSVVSYHADLGPYFSQLDGRKDNFIVHRFDTCGTNLHFRHQPFF
jgi:hypothetical protein